MKNTMKKLLCMALAIMLLVSAVPVFAAAAADITVIVRAGDFEDSFAFTPNGETANVGDILDYHIQRKGKVPANVTSDTPEAIWSNNKGGYVSTGDDVDAGDTVAFRFPATPAPAPDPDPEPAPAPKKHYVYVVVKLDGVAQDPVKKEIDGTQTTVGNLIKFKITQDLSDYKFVQAWNGTKVLNSSDTVYEDEKIEFAFEKIQKEAEPIKVIVKVGNSDNVVGTTEKVPANGVSAKVGDLLTYAWNSDWDNVYNFDHAWSEGKGNVGKNDSVNAGDTLYIMLKKDGSTSGGSTETPTTPSTTGKLSLTIRVNGTKKYDNDVKNFTNATVANVIKNIFDSDWTTKYAFDKVEVNGVTYGRADLEVRAGDKVDIYLTRKYSKDNSNKVYLHVYLNGDASTIAMTKDITGTYLMDDWKTDTTEILNYLKNNYYTAKDSSNAITIDGLYVSTDTKGAFPSNYYADNKTSSKDDINDLLEDGYVHISVMLKNAKAKSSSTADSSNPKTGDTIFVPVMVMGVTATALAAAYVFGKKRFAR